MYYITSDRERWQMKKQGARVVARRLNECADFMLHSAGKMSDKRTKAERLRRRAARVGACADEIYCKVCPECNIRYIIGHLKKTKKTSYLLGGFLIHHSQILQDHRHPGADRRHGSPGR